MVEAIPYPANRSGAGHIWGPLGDPLVCALLYRRAAAGLVVSLRMIREASAVDQPALRRQAARDRRRHRRSRRVGDARRHHRRPARLGHLLRHHSVQRLAGARRNGATACRWISCTSDPHHRGMGRRHVVPRRLDRRRSRPSGCSPAPQASISHDRRSALRRGADRTVLRPHRQFHQRRIVGTARRMFRGRWCFRTPLAICRAIRASSTKRAWKAFCCLAILQFGARRFRWMNRPGLVCARSFSRAMACSASSPNASASLMRNLSVPISMGMAFSIPHVAGSGSAVLRGIPQTEIRMNALAARIARLIEAQGPVSVAQFMAMANSAYYATRDPLGPAAISSPRRKSARCSASYWACGSCSAGRIRDGLRLRGLWNSGQGVEH